MKSIPELISKINDDLAHWDDGTKPWFRGESDENRRPLCPKIADYATQQENHLLQSFRRQAGGFANVPLREYPDMWLFLAQHYGIPTRLLDWTEGALLALYFAVNRGNPNPRVYMLNPRKLNDLAGTRAPFPNYPLTWGNDNGSAQYISLAWQNRQLLPWQQELRIPVHALARQHDPAVEASRVAAEMPLANDASVIASLLQMLGHMVPVAIETIEHGNVIQMGILPGEQRGATRRAD